MMRAFLLAAATAGLCGTSVLVLAQGGMVSHSTSSPPIVVHDMSNDPPPPIVAIPRQPGPTGLMVVNPDRSLRTIANHRSPEACEEALAAARQRNRSAFCVSLAPPPPEPDHAELLVIGLDDELLGIQSFGSMPECEQVRAAQPIPAGARTVCTKIKWH